MGTLTEAERTALEKVTEAWNAFAALPVEHPDDADEVRRAIHAINAKIMMRPTRRYLSEVRDA